MHLEDEPAMAYAQLVAQGLAPGMIMQVFEATAERIRFWAGGAEHILAPVLARQISVVPHPRPAAAESARPVERLTALRPGQEALVAAIAPACHGAERRRLLDLGILPGTRIQAALASPSGNPVAYRVRGSLIALRASQAEQIQISRLEEVST